MTIADDDNDFARQEFEKAMRVQPGGNYKEQGFLTNEKGAITSSIANIMRVLKHDDRWKGVISFCEFSYRIIKLKEPPFEQGAVGEWEDSDTARLRIWLVQQYGFNCKTSDADDAVLVSAKANPHHPVKDYLNSLEWDGNHRIESWLHFYLGAEGTDYEIAVGRMWLIAAVARVMRAPVKADCVLILEGSQGAGKSTALSVLGGEWFSDTHFALGEKDGYQQMQGVWICELAELDSFNKAESTRAKQFFSSQEDRYRPSYGRRAMTFPRQCVFAGSTNQEAYLKDMTGNRRYWPVRCGVINFQKLAEDRDQLWAEAVHLYLTGESWWPDETVKHLFHEEQEMRMQSDAWLEIIEDWFDQPEQRLTKHFTTAEIFEGALKLEIHQMKKPEETRLGHIMSKLGWCKERITTENDGKKKRKYVYSRPISAA